MRKRNKTNNKITSVLPIPIIVKSIISVVGVVINSHKLKAEVSGLLTVLASLEINLPSLVYSAVVEVLESSAVDDVVLCEDTGVVENDFPSLSVDAVGCVVTTEETVATSDFFLSESTVLKEQ